MSTIQILIGIYFLSALLNHIHHDISCYTKYGRYRFEQYPIYIMIGRGENARIVRADKQTIMVSFYVPLINTYRAIGSWILGFPFKKTVKKGCLYDKTEEMVNDFFHSLLEFHKKDNQFFEEQFADLQNQEQRRFIYWLHEKNQSEKMLLEMLKLLQKLADSEPKKSEIKNENTNA